MASYLRDGGDGHIERHERRAAHMPAGFDVDELAHGTDGCRAARRRRVRGERGQARREGVRHAPQASSSSVSTSATTAARSAMSTLAAWSCLSMCAAHAPVERLVAPNSRRSMPRVRQNCLRRGSPRLRRSRSHRTGKGCCAPFSDTRIVSTATPSMVKRCGGRVATMRSFLGKESSKKKRGLHNPSSTKQSKLDPIHASPHAPRRRL